MGFVSDPPMGKIDDVSADEFRKLLDLNFISYFLMAKVSIIKVVNTRIKLCFDRTPVTSFEILKVTLFNH